MQQDKWAREYGDSVTFLCISVEGLDVCHYFAKFVGASINATILPDEVPPFPIQLGCSGFVVIDETGNVVVTRSSPSFLDAGEDAFRAVEKLLSELGIPILRKSEQDEKSPVILKPLPHVGHCEMDSEHAEIDKCLAYLVETPTQDAIIALRRVMVSHFSHEEALLREMDFGQPQGGALSAYDSHASDHARIIKEVDAALGQPTEGMLPRGMISRLAAMIYQHGARFDSLYSSIVSCESCKKVAAAQP